MTEICKIKLLSTTSKALNISTTFEVLHSGDETHTTKALNQ